MMIEKHTAEHNKLENTIPISFEDARKLGQEYGELMIKKTLSAAEDARIDEILHLATVNDGVDFWVSHAACEYGAKIGLLSPEALESYEDQRAILRERIDTYQFTNPDEEAILYSLISQTKAQLEKQTQDTPVKILPENQQEGNRNNLKSSRASRKDTSKKGDDRKSNNRSARRR
jgi:hypothetical protein